MAEFFAQSVWFGVLLILERTLFPRFSEKLPWLSRVFTLLCVMLGWVVFRAETLGGALGMAGAMFGSAGAVPAGFARLLQESGFGGFTVLAFLAGLWFAVPHKERAWQTARAGRICRDAALLLVFGVCLLSLMAQSYNPFIYFQF